MKPVVGVMPLWDEEKDSVWILPGYLDGLIEAGAIPLVFPFLQDEDDIERLIGMCDGFLMTGGHDVSPGVYHEEPLPGLTVPCEKRDVMETVVLKRAIEEDMPVLGICRGIQFINALLGGTLYQDLPSQHPSLTSHQQKPPYDQPVHDVTLTAGTPLQECLGVNTLAVNSCHHQAVKTLAPGLSVMAVSEDGLIEALYKPDSRFLWALQWHPEFSFRRDENSRKIFRAFVHAMEEENN